MSTQLKCRLMAGTEIRHRKDVPDVTQRECRIECAFLFCFELGCDFHSLTQFKLPLVQTLFVV